ncbi:MAG: hypothetical protein NTY31_01560 [Candidatus Falkowbacteria bacterium]|nr:hypothetical protein [Candidatus Falkowbacteria bacterium]
MVNQQLLDYIKQQTQQGVNNEQIKQSLLANGWQNIDIEEAFNSINYSAQGQPISNFSNKAPVQIWKIIIVSLIGAVAIGGGIYFASKTFSKSKEVPKVSNEVLNQSPTSKPIETVKPSEQPVKEAQSQNPEIVFADKLNSCTKYKITFKHPITGEILEKEVLGIVSGKCDYVEQMPNGGKMECKYSEGERMVAAQYYKDVATAESAGTSVNANSGSGEQKTTYTINGKVVDNPLQEAMNTGVCVISGY